MWEMESLGTTHCPFGIPFHSFPRPFSIILSQPEAAPSFVCALVVKGHVVNVEIQTRSQYNTQIQWYTLRPKPHKDATRKKTAGQ